MSALSLRPIHMSRPRTGLCLLGLFTGLVAGGFGGPTRSARANTMVFTGSSVIFTGTGLAPDDDDVFWPVSARATFTIESGTTLQVLLENTSPAPTPAPAALLSSFYFAVGGGTNVPTLTYASAEGQVYQTSTLNPPAPGVYSPPATFTPGFGPSDLRAFAPNDDTWQFRSGLALVASSPPLTFGVGTVGNSGLDPYGFNGDIVDGMNFSIFRGAPQTANLAGKLFVKDSITFRFGGLDGFTLADIPAHVVFGFGTEPYVVSVPEPGGLALLATGGIAGGLAWRTSARRRRTGGGSRGGLVRRFLPGGLKRCSSPGGLTRCMLATFVVTALVIALLVASGPAHAEPIPVKTFDFSAGPQGWVPTNVAYNGKPPAGSTWKWQGGEWRVDPVSVLSKYNWVGNELTSPRIPVPESVDAFEFTIFHRFYFPVNLKDGQPLVAGQVVYRIFDGGDADPDFLPLLPKSFATGGISPPLTPYPDWMATNYTVPTALPPLVATGGVWTGMSPDFKRGDAVASRWVIDGGLTPGQEVQIRLINANLGRECDDGLWEVSSVEVVGLLPEPSTLGLAAVAAGAGLIVRNGVRSRRR